MIVLLALVHALTAGMMTLGSLASAWRPGTATGRRGAQIAGLAALWVFAWGLWRIRGWEPGYRRAVYLASHSAGQWLDRKAHFGIAACCFALGAMFVASDREARPSLQRLLATLSFVFTLLAWIAWIFVRARVPTASLE